MKNVVKQSRARTTPRSGLRVRGHRGHPEVRRAFVRFARWYRSHYDCPIRVPVYLHSRPRVITMTGESASASFFAPWNRAVEPYIRVATGDYATLKAEMGRDDALAAFICSLAHELVHYTQWLATGKLSERGVAVQAARILRRYAVTRVHP